MPTLCRSSSKYIPWTKKKLTEYYDGLNDPLRIYFMERIQMLLVSKEALNVLDKPGTKQENR